ncbi:MAG: SRPBCC domain-containing protein [Actinobacteria bacterium]|nr:SRPBCC domain-containing protein [Actinomycetota bacterium]
MTTEQHPALDPVRQSVTVARPPEVVFRVFTERLGEWWPLDTYSISVDEGGGGAPEAAFVEPREGGRIYERTADGAELEWGRVLVWDPPHRLVMSWRPNLTANPHTEIEVTFTPEGDGTRVDLEHRGWERLFGFVEDPGAVRSGYVNGWPGVLGLFADRAEREAA